jgi:hypothetical protein
MELYIMVFKVGKKTVALSIEEAVYNKYKLYCDEKGIILSRQVENFMKKELEKNEGAK